MTDGEQVGTATESRGAVANVQPSVESRCEKKRSSKSVREMDIASSDRIQLIDQANNLVRHMIDKETLPALIGGFSGAVVELSAEEQATYSAALGFLKRQFDLGFRERDIVEKRVENELSLEL